MGRRPRSVGLELIQNTRSRRLTYEKRKKGLEKKAQELSTLCDVKICMIMYGPKDDDDTPMEPTIWPQDPDMVRSLITSFKNTPKEDGRSRNIDITRFYEERTRHAEEELAKLCKVNTEAKYPTWDEHYQTLSFAELIQCYNHLDTKLQEMDTRIEFMKSTQAYSYGGSSMFNNLMEAQATQENNAYNMVQQNLYERNNMELELYQPQQHISSFNPMIADAGFQNSLDVNALTNAQMMMMMMNNDGASFNNVMPTANNSTMNGDYAPAGLVENAAGVVNNANPQSYCCVPGMQFQMPPYPLSQMHDSQMEKNGDQMGNFNLSLLLDPSSQMVHASQMEKNGDQMGNFNL